MLPVFFIPIFNCIYRRPAGFRRSISLQLISFAVLINFGTFVITFISGLYLDLSKRQQLLFSLLYTLSIYRLQDLINRQAIGELLALSFFQLSAV